MDRHAAPAFSAALLSQHKAGFSGIRQSPMLWTDPRLAAARDIVERRECNGRRFFGSEGFGGRCG